MNKLRQDNRLNDVTLSVAGKCSPCHAVVLAASSSKLRDELLKNDDHVTSSSKRKRIELEQIDSDSLGHIVHYMYSGRCCKANKYKIIETAATVLDITTTRDDPGSTQQMPENSANTRQTSDEYINSFLTELGKLRQTESLTDVAIETDNHTIPCHRCVLAACSDFFLAMFSSELSESKAETVRLREIDSDIVKSLVEFAYTGHLELNGESVEGLLIVANQLQWREVEDVCVEFLEERLATFNCLGIFHLAESLGYSTLSKKAKEFGYANFSKVCREDEILEVDIEHLIDLLSDDVIIDREETVVNLIIRWIESNQSRYEEIPYQQFAELIHVDALFAGRITNENATVVANLSRMESLQIVAPRQRRIYHQVLAFFGSYEMDKRQRNVEIYNPRTKKWRMLSVLPSSADAFISSVVPIGHDIWVSTLKRSTWIYSPVNDEWKEVRQQPGRVLNLYAAVYHCGHLYIIGGSNFHTNVVKATVDRYDRVKDSWKAMAPLLSAVGTKAAVTWRSYIYVIGGWNGTVYTNQVQRYDSLRDTWEFVAHCPARDTCGIGAATVGDFIYVVEGGDTFRYDPQEDEWSKKSSTNHPRSDFNLVTYNGYMCVLGGVHLGQHIRSIEQYDHRLDCWKILDTLEDFTIFSYPRCVAIQQSIVHRDAYKYSLASNSNQTQGQRIVRKSSFKMPTDSSVSSLVLSLT
uniref:Kelch-like protein diablo-like n=1 Tax=Saccoglossus kowalevskii TaxID=10224 RepID=A0ABM0GN83_SACKO|nr:PREDICTED: kelch-like protein diablo-like [Saccoglossus kowalevskii]